MRRVLIAGYFGMGNLGDEAILLGEYEWLKNNLQGIEISVLSGNPAKTSSELGCYAYSRHSLNAILSAISKCDLFILGGGGLFQDVTSFRSLLYYLLLVEIARWKRKRIAILAVGIGPLKRKISERLVERALKKADYLSLRDRASFDWAKGKGIENAILSADSSFLLPPPPKTGKKNEIAISLRRWTAFPFQEIERVLKYLSEKGLKLNFLLFNPADREISQYFQKKVGGRIIQQLFPREAIEYLSECSGTIAMRLHSGILSAIAGTPFLGLSYDPKVRSIASELEQPCLLLEESDKLIDNFEHLLENEEIYRASLKEKYSQMRERAERAIEEMKALLE